MRITILCVGRLKSGYLSLGVSDYEKRINHYVPISIVEVKDEKIGERDKPEEIVRLEAVRILQKIPPRSYRIALTEQGKSLNSVDFARFFKKQILNRGMDVTFMIGGALGLGPSVYEQSDLKLSLSPMTFPHQLARLILLEQIYRVMTMIRNEPYHK